MSNPCGAKTRGGKPCKRSPMPNGRCKLHGGASTGAPRGNANAVKHGIYSKHFTPEEEALKGLMNPDSVDEELYVCRLLLDRILKAESAAKGQPELVEVIRREMMQDGTMRETRHRVRDYYGLFNKIIGRIEALVKARSELMRGDKTKGDGTEQAECEVSIILPDEPMPDNPVL
jgi:hypothetical protein